MTTFHRCQTGCNSRTTKFGPGCAPQQYFMDGTRAKTCANANAPKLHEAVALMEKATRLLLDARDRQVRMLDA